MQNRRNNIYYNKVSKSPKWLDFFAKYARFTRAVWGNLLQKLASFFPSFCPRNVDTHKQLSRRLPFLRKIASCFLAHFHIAISIESPADLRLIFCIENHCSCHSDTTIAAAYRFSPFRRYFPALYIFSLFIPIFSYVLLFLMVFMKIILHYFPRSNTYALQKDHKICDHSWHYHLRMDRLFLQPTHRFPLSLFLFHLPNFTYSFVT